MDIRINERTQTVMKVKWFNVHSWSFFIRVVIIVLIVKGWIFACAWMGVKKPAETQNSLTIAQSRPDGKVTSSAAQKKKAAVPATVRGGIAEGKQQSYEVITDSDGIMPLLPMPEKKMVLPTLSVKTSETPVVKPVPVAPVSIKEKPVTVIEESAKPQAQSKPIQSTATATVNAYGKAVIYFHQNKYRLTADEKDQINLFLPYLKMASKNGHVANVSGFTCNIGGKKKNDSLAMERAQAVAGYLESQGIQIGNIKGEGQRMYISKNKNLNRRVEVEAVKKTTSTES